MDLTLDVDPGLRFLLPAARRASPVTLPWDGTSSLGHVVEAAGVPLTEVGRLAVDGRPVAPSYRPPAGALVRVAGRSRPQPLPTDPPRLLADVHLGTLARRLRLLGLDTAYRNDADDDELVDRARAERRLLLTQDRGLLRRRALREEGLWGAYVRGGDPDTQLADVLDRFAPPLSPWTRCPACNGLVEPVRKEEVLPRLEPGTRRRYEEFHRCRDCGRVYWRGAHAGRLEGVVAAARAQVGSGPGYPAGGRP